MSTELKTIENTGVKGVDLTITRFWGGNKRGGMVQLTQGLGGLFIGRVDDPGFIQLTVKDAYHVIVELTNWVKSVASDQAKALQVEINEKKELKKTILQEAVDCEKFIDNLEVIEIPLRLLK